jgi:aryl-alcohol dehydrogenase-like predicted oxidoreductase
MEETVRAMNHIIQQGKAFYWGTSEWNARQIMEAYQISRREHLIPPLMEQPEYNMFHRFKIEVEFAPLYKEIGLGTTIWSPLASGLLTGKYNKGIPEGTRSTLEGYGWLKSRFESEQALERISKVEQLTPITGKLGCTMAQLAIAWCLKNQNVSTVITGASKKNQMVENLEALEVVGLLNDEIMDRIETILDNKPQGEKDWR